MCLDSDLAWGGWSLMNDSVGNYTLSIPYTKLQKLARMLKWAARFALLVMVLGGAVRATQSGLACPDWPLCFSQPVPFLDMQIFMEWFHRLAAGLFGLSILYIVGFCLSNSELRRRTSTFMMLTVVLLVWQIMLGALTVLELLDAKVVSGHLINAVLLFSILRIGRAQVEALVRSSSALDAQVVPSDVKWGTKSLAVLVFAQICLGGVISSNNAGLICPDFPQCFGMWWPALNWLTDVQMLHRFNAAAVLIISIALVVRVRFLTLPYCVSKQLKQLPILMVLQVILGIWNVIFALPVWASIAHLAVGLLVYRASLAAVCETWVVEQRKAQTESCITSTSSLILQPR
jgi:cytochrome c oxidase assembly protein subunit 15